MGDELYHHGVKGQKWGIRKTIRRVGRKIKKAITNYKVNRKANKKINRLLATDFDGDTLITKSEAEAKRAVKLQKKVEKRNRKIGKVISSGNAKTVSKNFKQMSTPELQEALTRIELNKRISDYNTPNTRAYEQKQKGDSFTSSVLKSATKSVAIGAATTLIGAAARGENPIEAYKLDSSIKSEQALFKKLTLDNQIMVAYEQRKKLNGKTPIFITNNSKKKLRGIKHSYIDTDDINTDELYHHGVKGQKWGVRRAKAKLARLERKRIKANKKAIKLNSVAIKRTKRARKLLKKAKRNSGILTNKMQKNINKASKKALKATKKSRKNAKKVLKYDKKIKKLLAKIDSMEQSSINSSKTLEQYSKVGKGFIDNYLANERS